jgi:Zn-dependent protease with chaperone function
MPLTQDQFDALVARLEAEAARNPAAYKLKLGAFASLGYLYIFGVLLLLIAASAALAMALFASKGLALLVKKLVIPIVVLIWVVLKSLWVKLEAPKGLALARRDHPALFAAIEEVRRAARAPKAHVVLLTNELNAAIVQVPRLGMFGWQKNYLILGLPLMQLMSPAELKAVLAHEFGHLSGAHGRFGAWIYRVRAGWARLDETLRAQSHWGSFMFVPFFGWFAPKFAAYSFVQARRQEYEADRLAAETIGAAPLTSALVRLDLKAEELARHYWPGIYAEADQNPVPSASPYGGLLVPERRGFLPQAPEQLSHALARATSTADTHPCLKDRVAAMRLAAEVPPPVAESAAEALFGTKLGSLVEHFDAEWRASVSDWWQGRHAHVQNGRQKLQTYRGQPATELGDDALFEYAQLAEEFEGAESAFPLFETLAARESKPVGARFAHARLLLDRGDAAGIALLEALMAERPDAIRPACDTIVGFLRAHGREAETQPYIDRYWQRAEIEEKARAERETLRADDAWLPGMLSPDSLARLTETLARHANVKAAYLVQKTLPAGEAPLHVLGVVRKSRMLRFESGTADRDLVQALANEVRIPEEMVFLPLNDDNKKFLKRFKKVEGAKVY